MPDFHAGRDHVIASLRRELFGPWEPWSSEGLPVVAEGKALVTEDVRHFASKEEARGPWVDATTGEEILLRDFPSKRYGVGVLNGDPEVRGGDAPVVEIATSDGADEAEVHSDEVVRASAVADLDNAAAELDKAAADLGSSINGSAGLASEGDDLDLSGANDYKQSAMATSFMVASEAAGLLEVELRAGRYRQIVVKVEDGQRSWWLRSPLTIRATIPVSALQTGVARTIAPTELHHEGINVDGLNVVVSLVTRPREDGSTLVTAAVVNRTKGTGDGADGNAIFQARFRVRVLGDAGPTRAFSPYPPQPYSDRDVVDPEQESFDLLYRNSKTYAIGHGCSADWDPPQDDFVNEVRADPLPVVETPSTTPEVFIKGPDGRTSVVVPMAPLAGLDPDDDGFASVEAVVELYAEWIAERKSEVASLGAFELTGRGHLEKCERTLGRMRGGA